jgi:hypothetical protein
MKKTVMVIGLLLAIVCGIFAQVSVAGQTLYYKYVYTVDTETEAKSIVGGVKDAYITFTRNSCYFSDEKGIITPIFVFLDSWAWEITHIFQGEQNNSFVFMAQTKAGGEYYTGYLYFSKDYKRMNYRTESHLNNGSFDFNHKGNLNAIHVYEQTTPPQPKPQGETGPVGPDRMW